MSDQEAWIKKPTKAGYYWMSQSVYGEYREPFIEEVIDYQRPDRGLEVRVRFGTIPLKQYIKDYRPKSLWLYIEQPEMPRGR